MVICFDNRGSHLLDDQSLLLIEIINEMNLFKIKSIHLLKNNILSLQKLYPDEKSASGFR